MKRNCSLEEISDGKLYGFNDLVEASCNGCKGRATCCHGMGKSIILDPYDLYRLSTGLSLSFEALLKAKLELNMVDGIILPNLRMTGEAEACAFLDSAGKCSIHPQRPGICRIFPLGRYYENHDYKYFLQVKECSHQCSTKVKVGKWIDTPELAKNKRFLIAWHYFLNEVEAVIKEASEEKLIKNLNMYILNSFYGKSYAPDRDFYEQFYERLKEAESIIQKEG